MKKEKLTSLLMYKLMLEDRLAAGVPDKHKDHPEAYQAFLRHEIEMVSIKVEIAKLEGVS